jgi:hypothetical protein
MRGILGFTVIGILRLGSGTIYGGVFIWNQYFALTPNRNPNIWFSLTGNINFPPLRPSLIHVLKISKES